MGNLKDMIRAMVEQQVAEVVSEMMANATAEPEPSIEAGATMGQLLRKRSRKSPSGQPQNRVVYVLARKPGKRELADLRGNDARAYAYVVKHDGCTAGQVEAKTGLGRKATESSLWSLRHMGLIKSEPIA